MKVKLTECKMSICSWIQECPRDSDGRIFRCVNTDYGDAHDESPDICPLDPVVGKIVSRAQALKILKDVGCEIINEE